MTVRVASPTAAAAAIYEANARPLGEFVAALKPVPGQCGAAFAVNGTLAGLDLFDSAVTFANQARKAGATVAEALLQAGMIRMRPIVMTTMAMIFGMLPMALAFNDGGEIQAPMGRAIIGGVITSTILTLLVVPVLYSYLVRERKPTPVVPAPSLAGGAIPAAMPADRD